MSRQKFLLALTALVAIMLPGSFWFSAEELYSGIWTSNVLMGTDITHDQAGWYKVAFTSAGVNVVIDRGRQDEGGELYAGWVYDGYNSGIWTEVLGSTEYGYTPFIKVVVTD